MTVIDGSVADELSTLAEPPSTIALSTMDAVEDVLDEVATPSVETPTPTLTARIAYIGDHIHGDVLASRQFGWHAVGIVGM